MEGHKGCWGRRLGEFSKQRLLQGRDVRTRLKYQGGFIGQSGGKGGRWVS